MAIHHALGARRGLALLVASVLATGSLTVLSLTGPAPSASATHLPGPSVDCYYGTFDGWIVNENLGATDDVYDRDALASWFAPLPYSPAPLYNSVIAPGRSSGVLDNDFTLGFPADNHVPLSSTYRAILWASPDHAKSFTLNPDGSFTYVPADGYYGADSFQYVYASQAVGSPCSNVATVRIAAVDQVRTQRDVYTAYQDTPLEVGKLVCGFTCGLLDNDVLANRDTVVRSVAARFPVSFTEKTVGSFASIETDQGGTLTFVDPNGSFIYTPPSGFIGVDSFLYRARGTSPTGLQLSLGAEENAAHTRVTINVVAPPAPDVPAGEPDLLNAVEDTSLPIQSGDLLENDGHAAYIGYIGGALFDGQDEVRTQHGVLRIGWVEFIPGVPFNLIVSSMTYTPDPDFTGVDRFTYFVTNDPIDGATTPVDAFIDVAQVVDAPSVTNDTATIDEDTPTTVDVAANDTDGDGDLRPASVVEDPCDAHLCAPVGRDLYLHGEWTVNDDGTVTYTPERDYVGEAIFLYRISDALGQFGFGRVTVTVQASDAMDDGFDAVEDQLLSVAAPGVLGNDDPAAAGDNPIVTVPAEHGQVVMATDGSFTYLPGDDFAGKDQFTYEAGDDPATVTLDVAAVNDAPVVHLNPYCDPSQPLVLCLGDLDDRDLLEGEAAELRGSIADAEFDVGTYVIEWGDGSQSTGSYPCSGEGCPFEYFPTFNSGLCIPLSSCAGPLFFAFEHSYGDDPTGSAAYFPITMTVTEGDGTTSAGVSSARVLNSPPTMTLAPDCGAAEGSICLGDYSILAGQPGDLLRVGGKVDDIGRDVGTVTIDWGDGSEDTVIPTGCDDADSTCATPSERDFGCAATLTAPPSCGYFAGTHAYASGGDYIITVVADDGDGGVDQETATATVTHANGAPDASDGNVVTREDTAITVDLADLVTDGETADADLGYEVIVDPTAGTVTLAGSVATYVPSADANGVDSFEYRVTDRGAPDDCGEPSDDCSGSLGAMATIGVTVTAVNDAPSFTGGQNIHAVGDGVAVSEPGWATGISTGPADEASQTVEFVVDTEDSELFTADGQPAISADGTLTFTPAAGGIAELSVTAVDSGPATAPDDNSSEPQALTISIVPPNRAPVLISPDEPTGSYSDFLSFIVSASDPEDGLSGVTIEVEALPSGLTATGTAEQMTISGVLTAEPATYPVILRACDALHACSETVLNIVVQPEAMAVKLASSTPSAVPADASGVAPPITFSAKLIEDKDGRWGDLTRIQSSDLSGTLTSVVTGFETTCAPRIVKTTAARGNAPGTLELTCTFATGVPVGVYDVAFSVGGWFAGGASAALTVTATPVPGDTVTGAGSVALPGGGTGDFTFSVAPSGKKAVTGTWTYAERDAGAVVIRSVNATSITSFAVTGSGASRTVVITGKAQVDGIGGYDFRVTAIDGGGASDAYGQSVTGAKKAAAPPLSFTPLPLASGDIALQ